VIFFDGTYRLKPLDQEEPAPISEWTCAWRVRIINFALSRPDVQYLRPIVLYAAQTGDCPLRTTCAESLGKRICRDFDLKIDQILWVEQLPKQNEDYFVATFIQRPHMGPSPHDSVSWRPIHHNELAAIRYFIPEMGE
jgi:hypothetical protein